VAHGVAFLRACSILSRSESFIPPPVCSRHCTTCNSFQRHRLIQQTHGLAAPDPFPKSIQRAHSCPPLPPRNPPCLTAESRRPATLRCHVGGGGRRQALAALMSQRASPSHHPVLRSTLQSSAMPTLETDPSFAHQLPSLAVLDPRLECHHIAPSLVHLPPRRQQALSLSSVAVQNNP
jgi:hypothetical protein